MPGKPLFLSLDGIDGTGKSTQCRLLAQRLRRQGYQVTECVDPGGTDVGQHIRELLLDCGKQMTLTCEMFLFMASRAQLVEEIIRPARDAGHIVVSDRFLLANVVYQGHAGGLDPALLWRIGETATGGLLPDLTIVLDLPIERAQERLKATADRMESKGLQFQQKVREGFLLEAQRQPHPICVIDANADIETVHEEIYKHVADLL